MSDYRKEETESGAVYVNTLTGETMATLTKENDEWVGVRHDTGKRWRGSIRSVVGSLTQSLQYRDFDSKAAATQRETGEPDADQVYVSTSTLRRTYGLTPSMIDDLGGPDDVCENPYYRNGYPMRLYRIPRVEAWVEKNRDRLEKAKQERAKRSAAAKAAHERKRAEEQKRRERVERDTADWVQTVTISLEEPLPESLLSDVCNHFKVQDGLPTERQLVAYVRQRLTNFEALRNQLTWTSRRPRRELRHMFYPVLRNRVDAIVKDAVCRWTAVREAQPRSPDLVFAA